MSHPRSTYDTEQQTGVDAVLDNLQDYGQVFRIVHRTNLRQASEDVK